MTYLLSTGSLQLQPSSGWSLRATRCGFIACSPNSVTNCASAMLSPFASRRQKNDRRDAELLLDLLLHDDFPAVHVPAPASREVLALLRYRHRLVRLRTMLRNGLQAVAFNHQLRLGPKLFTAAGQQKFAALSLDAADQAQRQLSHNLLEALQHTIQQIEALLETRADDSRVVRLRTHPGVGLLTALAVVHTLEPVSRFRQARCVWVSGRRSANAVIIQNETFSPRARHLHRVSF